MNDPTAAPEGGDLLARIYAELRAIAGNLFRHHGPGHTLQPTALVHEAYLKLAEGPDRTWDSRSHFLAVASKAMRQILIDHHRRKNAQKRGGADWERMTLSGVAIGEATPTLDVIALNDALDQLERLDPRQARVVELRYFGGLTVDEIAEVLAVSKTTVENEWRHARAWLTQALSTDA
ncbi:MAG: sigma-70 family RNA polymerase sigma factor [Planctomycetota bacterium]